MTQKTLFWYSNILFGLGLKKIKCINQDLSIIFFQSERGLFFLCGYWPVEEVEWHVIHMVDIEYWAMHCKASASCKVYCQNRLDLLVAGPVSAWSDQHWSVKTFSTIQGQIVQCLSFFKKSKGLQFYLVIIRKFEIYLHGKVVKLVVKPFLLSINSVVRFRTFFSV